MSESASRSDILRELRGQELVVLGIKLVQVLRHWLIRVVVHGAERNCLGGVGKHLDCLARLDSCLILDGILILRDLMRLRLSGGLRKNDLNLVGYSSLNRGSSKCLEVLSLLSQLIKLLGRFKIFKVRRPLR